jgi:hypothetical protein
MVLAKKVKMKPVEEKRRKKQPLMMLTTGSKI